VLQRAPDVLAVRALLPIDDGQGQPAIVHGGGDNVLSGGEKLHKMGPWLKCSILQPEPRKRYYPSACEDILSKDIPIDGGGWCPRWRKGWLANCRTQHTALACQLDSPLLLISIL
jgi:hypothetical protein